MLTTERVLKIAGGALLAGISGTLGFLGAYGLASLVNQFPLPEMFPGLPVKGNVFLSVKDADKTRAVSLARDLGALLIAEQRLQHGDDAERVQHHVAGVLLVGGDA